MSFLLDLENIALWWSVFFFFGLINLPLTLTLFKSFFDKGYIFSKTSSVFITTYLVFVLSSFHIVKFDQISILGAMLILAISNYFIILKNKKLRIDFNKTIKKIYKYIIFQELLFFSILVAWSYLRGLSPEIDSLEKFMDWGFINSSLKSEYLPPLDMWYSGSAINYYYFGHLFFALLTKISTIPSSITYNLSVSTICALTFVSTFSFSTNIIYSVYKKSKKLKIYLIVAALLSSFLITFGGNLQHIYKISKLFIESGESISYSSISNASKRYWYPDATRFIGYDPDTTDKTIHEFPLYSFVVSDLHGHMNDIPVAILFSALLLSLFLSGKNIFSLIFVLPVSFVLTIAYMTNAWDFAVYGLLFGISAFLYTFSNNRNFILSFNKTFIVGIILIVLWYIFSWPFSHLFTPMAQGVQVSDAHTPFYQLFILYGGFWLITFPFVIHTLYLCFFKKNRLIVTDIFALSLIALATILVIIPEFIYIKDIYTSDFRRANTMFKLVYQAFILYSLSSGYVAIRLSQNIKNKFINIFYRVIVFFIFITHLSYSYFAINSYYTPRVSQYKTLDGSIFIKNKLADNYEAINWINSNIKGQPVMLEASGDSYTYYNHVSVSTGLPTVVGWLVHEWLWRNGYDGPAARQSDVEKIYKSEDVSETKKLIDKYKIKYIFVGVQENEKYPDIDTKKFEDIGGKIVFETGKTKIYQMSF